MYAYHPDAAPVEEFFRQKVCVDGVFVSAIGLIEAWGDIELYEDGFRAQFARVRDLILRDCDAATDYESTLRQLASAYAAEVIQLGGFRELRTFCTTNHLGLSGPVVAEIIGDGDPTESDNWF